jgi:diguanylate cyclase (GGDEF)-like protein
VIEVTNLLLLRERFGAFLTQRLYDRLGERLAQHSREIDVIGQYRASGYTMILSEAEPEGAQNAARRLLSLASEAKLDAEERVDGLELHLACGWASFPADGATTETLFAAAERRMYDPKTQVA